MNSTGGVNAHVSATATEAATLASSIARLARLGSARPACRLPARNTSATPARASPVVAVDMPYRSVKRAPLKTSVPAHAGFPKSSPSAQRLASGRPRSPASEPRAPARGASPRGEGRGEDAELARFGDGDVEVRGDVTQNRREGQDACLACEQGEEEHDRWRPEARGGCPLRGPAVRSRWTGGRSPLKDRSSARSPQWSRPAVRRTENRTTLPSPPQLEPVVEQHPERRRGTGVAASGRPPRRRSSPPFSPS